MNKFKLFVENFLVYGVGGIISRIIPIIMIPIITRLMPNTEYFGISDMSHTLVQFGSALALMGMYDAMYRMFFEKEDEDYKKSVCATALSFTIVTSIIIFIIMIIFREPLARRFFDDKQYTYVVYLSAIATLVSATNSIVAAPTRMQNKRILYLVMNTVGPLVSYGIAIPLLLAGYYTIALPLSTVISGIAMEASFFGLNRKWFKLSLFNKEHLKNLLKLGVPLLPNFIIYWVFNSCDKVMITNIIGVGAAGIYSAGSKLGHISQLIYTAFAGGWQYFAFYTMKDKNQVETNSRIYEYLGLISFLASSAICVLSLPAFKIIFSEQYLSGFIVAPYLFLAPLLQMLYQTGNNQFLVVRKTWPGMFILSAGAITNIILNAVLIPKMGIEGAAVATLCGYIISCLIDILALIKCNLMKPSLKFLAIVIGMALYLIIWRMFFSDRIFLASLLCIVFWGFCLVIYRNDVKLFYQMITNRKVEQ